MWAEAGKEYEIDRKTEYFDYNKFVIRTRYNWPGLSDGRWRPPLTAPSEVITILTPGTKIKVIKNLYRAVSANMKYQSVQAEVAGLTKKGFVYLYHKDIKFFREVTQQQPEPLIEVITIPIADFITGELKLQAGKEYRIQLVRDDSGSSFSL